ncbi:MAG: class I adenylate cyclase [Pseudomonadota bacterium]|nr:class I adenylate cyclase [Pseudomonadota bacterium]
MSTPSPSQRFSEVNAQRLQRLEASVSGRQTERLRCLVLALHSGADPAGGNTVPIARGIRDFQLDEKSRSAWYRQTGRQPAPLDEPNPAIRGIYVMGSSGTIAFNAASDFDIWVCCDPIVAVEQGELLRARFNRLEQWAAAANLETHFYLVTTDRFRGGTADAVSKESSGSAQSLVLLDEFYRTAILLAGQPPLWWVVPPERERDYDAAVAELVAGRVVSEQDYINFGGLADIPRDELHGAALWQVFKALDSPHKTILKILLMEAYAAQLPRATPLSHDYKRLLLSDQADTELLDPYLMMYGRIERHLLARGETDRLETARQCLYLKVGEKLSRPRTAVSAAGEIMATYVREWGWSRAHVLQLDHFGRWDIEQVLRDYRAVVKELTACYSRIANFAKEAESSNSIRGADVQVLGRRIYAAFERRPGKLDLIHYPAGSGVAETAAGLRVTRNAAGQEQWILYAQGTDTAMRQLKRAATPWEVLAWGALNGVLVSGTRFLPDASHQVSTRQISALVRCVCRWLTPTAAREARIEDLSRSSRITHLLVVQPPAEDEASRESWCLTRTSWGEVLHRSFTSQEAIVGPLRLALSEQQIPAVRIVRSDQPEVTAEPLVSVLAEAADALRRPRVSFLFPVPAAGYGVVWRDGGAARVDHFSRLGALLEHLGKPNGQARRYAHWSGWRSREPLAELLRAREDGAVQVFVSVRGSLTYLYLFDELGALYVQRTETYSLKGHLAQVAHFLGAVMERERLICGVAERVCSYYRLDETGGIWRARAITLNTADLQRGPSGLQAFCPAPDALNDELLIRCAGVEFSTQECGERIYEQVARHLLSMRRDGGRYPAHLADLDFTQRRGDDGRPAPLQTGHYWRAKRLIEDRLTRHIKAVDAVHGKAGGGN